MFYCYHHASNHRLLAYDDPLKLIYKDSDNPFGCFTIPQGRSITLPAAVIGNHLWGPGPDYVDDSHATSLDPRSRLDPYNCKVYSSRLQLVYHKLVWKARQISPRSTCLGPSLPLVTAGALARPYTWIGRASTRSAVIFPGIYHVSLSGSRLRVQNGRAPRVPSEPPKRFPSLEAIPRFWKGMPTLQLLRQACQHAHDPALEHSRCR